MNVATASNKRKRAFEQGLRKMPDAASGASRGTICAIRPSLYNAARYARDQPDHPRRLASRSSTTGPRAGSTWSSPTRRSTSATSTTATTTSATTDDYLEVQRGLDAAVHRALKPTGSFYLAIGDEYAADLCVIARRKIGFHLRNWIIWHYTFGQQTKKMFARSHTHILYFTKERRRSSRSTPTRSASPAPARRPTPTPAPIPRASCRTTRGSCARRKPRRTAYFEPDGDTWNVSRVCGTFKEREGWHGCQMPIGVLNRIIKASSNPGDIVLDPFNGSARRSSRPRCWAASTSGSTSREEYVGYARKRLEHALAKAAPATRDGQRRRRRGGRRDRPEAGEQGDDRDRRLRPQARRPPPRGEDGVRSSVPP